jgi:hypothetical protein
LKLQRKPSKKLAQPSSSPNQIIRSFQESQSTVHPWAVFCFRQKYNSFLTTSKICVEKLITILNRIKITEPVVHNFFIDITTLDCYKWGNTISKIHR